MYQDIATRDKLIFPSAIMRILQHLQIPIPSSLFFITMVAISAGSVQRSETQLRPKQPQVEMDDLAASIVPPSSLALSTSTPSSSAAGITLDAIME